MDAADGFLCGFGVGLEALCLVFGLVLDFVEDGLDSEA